jgi:hypothetical protein
MPKTARKKVAPSSNVIPFPFERTNGVRVVLPVGVRESSIGTIVMRGANLIHRGIFDGDYLIVLDQLHGRKLKPSNIVIGWIDGSQAACEVHSMEPNFELTHLVIGFQRDLV